MLRLAETGRFLVYRRDPTSLFDLWEMQVGLLAMLVLMVSSFVKWFQHWKDNQLCKSPEPNQRAQWCKSSLKGRSIILCRRRIGAGTQPSELVS